MCPYLGKPLHLQQPSIRLHQANTPLRHYRPQQAERWQRELAESLGLSVLVEAHDEEEIERAVESGAKIVGVNNRNLKDFSVDFGNARRLRSCIPEGVLYVAESGVASADDVAAIAQLGADAVLIGEALMRAEDKPAMLAEFRAAAEVAQ